MNFIKLPVFERHSGKIPQSCVSGPLPSKNKCILIVECLSRYSRKPNTRRMLSVSRRRRARKKRWAMLAINAEVWYSALSRVHAIFMMRRRSEISGLSCYVDFPLTHFQFQKASQLRIKSGKRKVKGNFQHQFLSHVGGKFCSWEIKIMVIFSLYACFFFFFFFGGGGGSFRNILEFRQWRVDETCISSSENQKGINTVQRCYIENWVGGWGGGG